MTTRNAHRAVEMSNDSMILRELAIHEADFEATHTNAQFDLSPKYITKTPIPARIAIFVCIADLEDKVKTRYERG